jgi:hypothetical protein
MITTSFSGITFFFGFKPLEISMRQDSMRAPGAEKQKAA